MKIQVTTAVVAATIVLGSAGTAHAAARPHVESIEGSPSRGFVISWSDGAVEATASQRRNVTACAYRSSDAAQVRCVRRVREAFYWMTVTRRTLAAESSEWSYVTDVRRVAPGEFRLLWEDGTVMRQTRERAAWECEYVNADSPISEGGCKAAARAKFRWWGVLNRTLAARI